MNWASLILTLLVCLLAVPFFGLGQGTDASLTGIVTDPSHAAIPGARVTGRNKSTNFAQEVTTDAAGSYAFLNLPIGTYILTVEQRGFSKATIEVTIETAQKARYDVELKIGEAQQTVTVELSARNVSTQDASLGAVINNNTVADTPLYLRNWDDLLRPVPGVQFNRYTDQSGATSAGRTGAAPRVHGELVMLGFDVSERTITRWMKRAPRDPELQPRPFSSATGRPAPPL